MTDADEAVPTDGAALGGPPLVVVHGTMDRAAGFRRTAVHLPRRAVLAYDRRGYARSRSAAVADDVASHVDDLAVACAVAADRWGAAPLVVGHSFGGIVALHLLARGSARPGAAGAVGAVVWEAPLGWMPWYPARNLELASLDPGDAAERFMRSMIGDRLWGRLPTAMRAERRAEGPALVADIAAASAPSAEVPFDRIDAPVLVGCGTRSRDDHRRSAREAAAAIAGARLEVVDGADHGIHLSAPASFARLIERWG